MKIGRLFASIRDWLSNRLRGSAEELMQVMEEMVQAADLARQTVVDIELQLKPAIRNAMGSVFFPVRDFIEQRINDPAEAHAQACKVGHLPKAELLAGVALFLVSELTPAKKFNRNALEGGIRIAYGAYKLLHTKKVGDETKVH